MSKILGWQERTRQEESMKKRRPFYWLFTITFLFVVGIAIFLVFMSLTRREAPSNNRTGMASRQLAVDSEMRSNAETSDEEEIVTESPTPRPPGWENTPEEYPDKLRSLVANLRNLREQSLGRDLLEHQIDLISDIGYELSYSEIKVLMNNLHYYVADAALVMGWSTLTGQLLSREEFSMVDFVQSLPEGRRGLELLSMVASSFRGWKPPLSRGELDQISDSLSPELFDKFLGNYGSALAEFRGQEGYDLALSQDYKLPDKYRAKILYSIESPKVFATNASSMLDAQRSQEISDQIFLAFVGGWSETSPNQVADWVQQIETSEAKSAAAEQLVKRWARNDVQSAASWLANHEFEGRDGAISVLVDQLKRYSPDEARAWANEIQNDEYRNEILSKID